MSQYEIRPTTKVRLLYTVLLFAWSIVAAILRDYAVSALKSFPAIDLECDECVGTLIVFRVFFALFVFHGAFAVFMLGYTVPADEPLRRPIHDSLWPVKAIVQIGLFLLTLVIPNGFFLGWAQFARGASVLYIIIQVVIIILFSYYWNYSWIDKDPPWIRSLIGCSVAMFVAALTFIGLMYHYYARESGCGINVAWITITLILAFFLSLPVVRIPFATPLTSSMISLYMTYLCWSALQSQPRTASFQCNTLFDSEATDKWVQFIGLAFTLLVCIYSAFRAASREADDPFDEIENEHLDYTPPYFHLIFALAACYISAVLSNWEIGDTTRELEVDKGWVSAWVKFGSVLFVALIYAWTLAAPYCTNREYYWARDFDRNASY